MKKFLLILSLGLILFVVQPANVLKADLASDILKKTQELAEKQKIKGKKLNELILNNVIIVDYDGKKQSYKLWDYLQLPCNSLAIGGIDKIVKFPIKQGLISYRRI